MHPRFPKCQKNIYSKILKPIFNQSNNDNKTHILRRKSISPLTTLYIPTAPQASNFEGGQKQQRRLPTDEEEVSAWVWGRASAKEGKEGK